MKKILIVGMALVFACTAFGVKRDVAPDMVMFEGKGKLVFVNAAGIDDTQIKAAAETIGNLLSLETEVRKGEWSMATAKKGLADIGATAAVYVIKDDKLPMSLIAMEEKWGAANANGLSDEAVYKMALRVAVVVIGGASSKYPASVMRPVFSKADLEKAGKMMTIDSLMAIDPNLKDHGFKPYQIVDYVAALEAGVAPPPANEEQKKLKEQWEEEKKAEEAAAAAKKAASQKK